MQGHDTRYLCTKYISITALSTLVQFYCDYENTARFIQTSLQNREEPLLLYKASPCVFHFFLVIVPHTTALTCWGTPYSWSQSLESRSVLPQKRRRVVILRQRPAVLCGQLLYQVGLVVYRVWLTYFEHIGQRFGWFGNRDFLFLNIHDWIPRHRCSATFSSLRSTFYSPFQSIPPSWVHRSGSCLLVEIKVYGFGWNVTDSDRTRKIALKLLSLSPFVNHCLSCRHRKLCVEIKVQSYLQKWRLLIRIN